MAAWLTWLWCCPSEDPAGSSEFEEQSAAEAEVVFLVAPTRDVTCQSALFKMLEGSSTFVNGIAESDCSLFHYVGLLRCFFWVQSLADVLNGLQPSAGQIT